MNFFYVLVAKKYFVDEVNQKTVTIDSTEVISLPDCQAIGNIFAELGNQRAELEQIVEDLLTQIQELGNEVVVKFQALEESPQQLSNTQNSTLQSTDTNSVDQEFHLRQVLRELDEIKKELAEERVTNHPRAGSSQVTSEDFIRQLNVARQELAEARNQLQQQRFQLENFESLKGSEHAQRMQQLEQEREALEAELELVRRRASEMNNALNEHKQQALLQKEEWTAEISQLREIVETQASQPPQDPEPPPGATPEIPKSPRSPGEHVVGTVMAQFAKVQQDVARRRSKRKKEG